MNYTEADLPVVIKETEVVSLPDGSELRFEENGGARDIMVTGDFAPRAQLFPGNEYTLDVGGDTFLLTATEDALEVKKV